MAIATGLMILPVGGLRRRNMACAQAPTSCLLTASKASAPILCSFNGILSFRSSAQATCAPKKSCRACVVCVLTASLESPIRAQS